jgi:hypothetical protein
VGADRVDQPLARARVAVPLVGVEEHPVEVHGQHDDGVGQQDPAGRGRLEPLLEPRLLLAAQEGALVVGLLAAGADPVVAGLVIAVLAPVEQHHLRQIPEGRVAVDAQRVGGGRIGPDRHVLPPHLVGGGAARGPVARVDAAVLGVLASVVVVDLVVVPDGHERRAGVQGPQVRVGLVEAVAVPVPGQVPGLVQLVGARAAVAPAALVDVVAQADDQIELLGGHVPLDHVPAARVALAGREADADGVHLRVVARQRAGAADLAGEVPDPEAVPVGRGRVEAVDVDVHAVAVLPRRGGQAGLEQLAEALVRGQLPDHVHVIGGRGGDVGRLDHEPRPQDDAVVQRVARRDAQAERRRGERRGPGPRGVPGRGRLPGPAGAVGIRVEGGGVPGVGFRRRLAARERSRGRAGRQRQEGPAVEPGLRGDEAVEEGAAAHGCSGRRRARGAPGARV